MTSFDPQSDSASSASDACAPADSADGGGSGESGHVHEVKAEEAAAAVRDAKRFRRRKGTHLITDAKVGPGQDRRRREVEYVILQALRLPSLALVCIFLALHWWLAAAITVGITIPLPWIAVVLGNSKGQVRDERERMTYRPGLARQQQQAREAQALAKRRAAQLGYDPETTIDHDDDEPGSDTPDGRIS